jgi:hypothetical protein
MIRRWAFFSRRRVLFSDRHGFDNVVGVIQRLDVLDDVRIGVIQLDDGRGVAAEIEIAEQRFDFLHSVRDGRRD